MRAYKSAPRHALVRDYRHIILHQYVYIHKYVYIYIIGVLVVFVALIGHLFTLLVAVVVGLLTALRAAPWLSMAIPACHGVTLAVVVVEEREWLLRAERERAPRRERHGESHGEELYALYGEQRGAL